MLNERLAMHWRRLADSVKAPDPMVQERLETWAETFEGMIAGDPAAAALKRLCWSCSAASHRHELQ
jgi:hypothetical protein